MKLDASYWEQQYQEHRIGWDMGYPSPPLVEYIKQLDDKSISILVPGAGNAWEVEYLWRNGFKNTHLLDFSSTAIQNFKNRVPDFPVEKIYEEDFFQHGFKYDLILEQTFYSSFLPKDRALYAKKMYDLLNDDGKLVGLLFNHKFSFQGPPFGSIPEEYLKLFQPLFDIKIFDTAYNSIKPRKAREHFMIAIRKIDTKS